MVDEDRMCLVDIVTELECDTVRASWGRIVMTCDRTMALNALDCLIKARHAVALLLSEEAKADAAKSSAE